MTRTEYPNLVSVFKRVFPIVSGSVAATEGATRRVEYHGGEFEMVGETNKEKYENPYAFRVFKITQ